MGTNYKKTKNIFQLPILHDNLFHQEVVKISKVGGQTIQPGWLKNSDIQTHYKQIKSSISLAQLYSTLQQLQSSNDSNQQLNMFKIAEIKRKIQHFEAEQSVAQTKKPTLYVPTDKIMAQKVTDFFHTSYERDARIDGATLFIESKKGQNQIAIDLKQYTIQLQQKQSPLKKVQFEHFIWPAEESSRLLLYGNGLRSYCLYTPSHKNIEKILTHIRTKCLNQQSFGIIEYLNKQFCQKAVALSGNRMRVYEHMIKNRKKEADDDNIYASPSPSPSPKRKHVQQTNLKQEARKLSVLEDSPQGSSGKMRSEESNIISSMIQLSPNSKPRITTSSMFFRLKGNRATIHYDELEGAIDCSKSPDIHPSQFHLGINDEVRSDEQISHFSHQDRMEELKLIEKQSQEQSDGSSLEDEVPIQYKTRVSAPKSRPNQFNQAIIEAQVEEDMPSQILKDINLNLYCGIGQIEALVPSERQQFTFILKQVLNWHTKIVKDNPQTGFVEVQSQIQSSRQITYLSCSQQFHYRLSEPSLEGQKANRIYTSINHMNQFMVSNQSNDFIIIIKTEVQELKLPFKIMTNVRYQKNISQFFYTANFIVKINMYLSPKKILSWKKMSTMQFMKSYLLQNNQDYNFKHNFIEEQKRNYQVQNQWNRKLIKKIVNSNDQLAFQKALYRGIPNSILQKIKKNITKQGKDMDLEFNYTERELKKFQDVVFQSGIHDIKLNIKPLKVIEAVLNARPHSILKQRITQLKIYYIHKYGHIRDLGIFIAKNVVKKLLPLLSLCHCIEQVRNIIDLYFEVEYQIDQLFTQISKYSKN